MAQYIFCGQHTEFELSQHLIRWAIERIALLEKNELFLFYAHGNTERARVEIWDKIKPFYAGNGVGAESAIVDDEKMQITTEKGGKVAVAYDFEPCHYGMQCLLC